MTTHTLSWPLTIEPSLSPPQPPPLMPCWICDVEDELDRDGSCVTCAQLLELPAADLAQMVVELRDRLASARREGCDCRGTGVLTDDDASHCPCGRAS